LVFSFGAAIVLDFSFGAASIFVVSFCAFDLLPKHEQSAIVEDFFFISDFGSIASFSMDFIGGEDISTAGTIFDVIEGTSSSNDGGDAVISLDKIEIGSVEGNSNVKSGSLGGDSRFSSVCFSTINGNSGG
jgi:hypothetical protein